MPPSTFDLTYEPRPWRCDECGRILGVVMRVLIPGSSSVGSHRIRKLWVFRTDHDDASMPTIDELRKPQRGLFKVHGVNQCQGVECSMCGALNEWSMSKESYLQLISNYQSAPG